MIPIATEAAKRSDAPQKVAEAANFAAHSAQAEANFDALKVQESSSFARASQPAVVGSCVVQKGPLQIHS